MKCRNCLHFVDGECTIICRDMDIDEDITCGAFIPRMAKGWIEFGKTNRGFGLGEFLDYYKAKCSVQLSSLATTEAIWLGCDELMECDGKESNRRMHLTRDMARQLADVLILFAQTGTIREDRG